jgi:hypothetical protein
MDMLKAASMVVARVDSWAGGKVGCLALTKVALTGTLLAGDWVESLAGRLATTTETLWVVAMVDSKVDERAELWEDRRVTTWVDQLELMMAEQKVPVTGIRTASRKVALKDL